MFGAGTAQRQIARTLSAAYANGLLSEDTFLRRANQLLGGGMIEPARLIGDLHLRRTRGASVADRAGAAVRHFARRIASAADHRPSPTLLALDWSGAQSEMLIGRHHDCDVVLNDLTVSRRHARLVFRDRKWILQDLDSTNGTNVNGCRVGRCEVRPGDDVAIGDKRLIID